MPTISYKKYNVLNYDKALLNGISYDSYDKSPELDLVLSRAQYEGFNIPNNNTQIALDQLIKSMKADGSWEKQDTLFNFAYNDTNLFNFSLINLKNPWSITNLITYSRNWSNSSWGGDTKVPNHPGTLAPDGTQTACYFTDVGRTTLLRKVGIISNSTTLTYSIYVKPVSATFSTFLLRNETTATNFNTGIITFSTGVITGAGWTATSVGNGWFRVQYTQTTGISVGDEVSIYYGRTSTTGSPSTADWYVWGAQVEDRDIASKYLPTGSTAIYGNSIAIKKGGTLYTTKGWEANGLDGYINTTFNPIQTGFNYKANEAGLNVGIYYDGGNYEIGQGDGTSNRTLFNNGNSNNQRINNSTSLSSPIDLSGTGFKSLNRLNTTDGNYTNGALNGTFTYTNPGTLYNGKFNLLKIPSGTFSDSGLFVLFIGKPLTLTQSQNFRNYYQNYCNKINLTLTI